MSEPQRPTAGRGDTPVRPDGSPPRELDPSAESEHEGGTEKQVGDRTGPGAGYDQEPDQTEDQGGVAGG
jgi:hypothetical protein